MRAVSDEQVANAKQKAPSLLLHWGRANACSLGRAGRKFPSCHTCANTCV